MCNQGLLNRSSGKLLMLFVGLLVSAGLPAGERDCASIENLTEKQIQQLETFVVSRVVDGDTLKLANGRKIRLIGVNTPELGYDGRKSQPFARQAKVFVEDLLEMPARRKTRVKVLPGSKTEDRHGRLLGHVFTAEGESLEAKLLEHGLAYHVAVPPNLSRAACLAAIEQQAARSRAGLWGQELESLAALQTGYQRIRARVKSVTFGRSWWISFDTADDNGRLKNFVAVLYPESQQYITRSAVEEWIGRTITVKGWVYRAHYQGKPQLRLKLETPYAWTLHE